MDEKVDELAALLLEELKGLPADRRLLVGVCGIPGSGKSSLASHIVSCLNTNSLLSTLIGMDGWHYTRQALSQFPDPKLAFDRRGAEFTFDSSRFADFVESLKYITTETLRAPSFDHAKKDPVQDDLQVTPDHRVVLVEGLYCNCSVGDWGRAAKAMDHRWVCLVDREEAMLRLVKRHVATGVAANHAEAIWRAENNDLPNGDWLIANLLEPYTIVESKAEASWAS